MDEFTGVEGASTEQRLRTVLAGLGLTVGGFIVAIIVVLLGINVLEAVIGIRDRPILLYPALTILQGLGFGLAVLGYIAITKRTGLILVRFPSLRDIGVVVAGTLALFAALAGISVVFSALSIQAAENQITEIGSNNPEVMLYMIPLAFLVIGPGEELLFRGTIQGLFRESYAAAPAIALSSGLFAVAHVTALLGSSLGAKAATIVALFALSLILGVVYEYTDNLVVPALIHGAYDAILFLAIYASATGLAG